MMVRQFFLILLGIIASLHGHLVYAHQSAEVLADEAIIYQLPSRNSSQMTVFGRKRQIKVSSHTAIDGEGHAWFKVLISPKVYGYIMADEVATLDTKINRKIAGFSPMKGEPEPNVDAPWGFVLRGMVLGELDSTGSFGSGGEIEFTSVLPFEEHGYYHRMISLGGAFLQVSQNSILAASAIFRFFSFKRVEPEIRLRFGMNFTTATLQGGLNIGINYPFSLEPGAHWAGYLEAGSIMGLSGAYAGAAWVAGGLGFHF